MDERQRRLYGLLVEMGMEARRAALAVQGLPDPTTRPKAVRRAFADGPFVLADGKWLVLCRRCGDELGVDERSGHGPAVQAALEQGWKISDKGRTAVCPVCRGG